MFKLNRNFNILENVFQRQTTLTITKYFSEVQIYVLGAISILYVPKGP